MGDRAGVGAQIGACYTCRACTHDNENYCPKSISTYADEYPDGVRTQGGYATAIRAHEQFVFAIPEALESRYAASMLCAGLTVFSPLKRNGCGPGKKVGIIGVGGLVSVHASFPCIFADVGSTGTLCGVVCQGYGRGGLRVHARHEQGR